ncbi:MAG: hypothetical protein ACF788_00520, partial [Novipirellula sp. JB048]
AEAQPQITQFLIRFPDDPRFEKVQQLERSLKLKRTLRRLRIRAKLSVSPLSAAEQGFVDAMQHRQQDPTAAAARLTQWLAIYDTPTVPSGGHALSDDALAELIVLAQHEAAQLAERAPAVMIDPRAAELLDRIDHTVSTMSPAKAIETLNGIVQLHSGQPWAKPAVDVAERWLQTLEPPSPEPSTLEPSTPEPSTPEPATSEPATSELPTAENSAAENSAAEH